MVTSGGHKLPATLLSLVSKQVLVTIGDNDTPRHTVVDKVSPNGLYVNFASDRAEHEHIGWVKVSDVKVLDVF